MHVDILRRFKTNPMNRQHKQTSKATFLSLHANVYVDSSVRPMDSVLTEQLHYIEPFLFKRVASNLA